MGVRGLLGEFEKRVKSKLRQGPWMVRSTRFEFKTMDGLNLQGIGEGGLGRWETWGH